MTARPLHSCTALTCVTGDYAVKTAELRAHVRARSPLSHDLDVEAQPDNGNAPDGFVWPYWTQDALIGLAIAALVVLAWWALMPLMSGRHSATQHVARPTEVASALTPQAEALSDPTGAPLLWIVKSDHATVYLFGSVHLLRPNLDWMDARLFKAFDTADQAWFEVPDLDKLPHFKGFPSRVMASKPVLTAGLTEIEKTQLEAILNQYNYTTKDLSHVRPWAVAAMISELDMQGGNYTFQRGADNTLFHRARSLKIRTEGFEDNRLHYSYLYELGPSAPDGGTAKLKSTLAAYYNKGATDGDLGTIVPLWRAGDEKALTNTVMSGIKSDPREYNILLVERNRKWLPQIETMLKGKGTIFITVGTAHLLGPDGLVTQLRARGYKVTRLDPA